MRNTKIQEDKEVVIITEGDFDAKVLNKIFADNSNVKIMAASGYSSAISKARSLMSHLPNTRIILLLDTDTLDQREIDEKQDFVSSFMNIRLHENDIKVVWAVPEFEIIFLNNKEFLKAVTSHQLNKDLIEFGKFSPRRALESITQKNRKDLLQFLDNKQIKDEFYKDKLVSEIVDFANREKQ